MKQEDISYFIERNLKNFSVNSTGWNDLIGKMLSEMAVSGWNMEYDVFGKERFGELYCTIYSENEELNIVLKKITEKYSELSQKVCEICGAEGKKRTINSWQTTLCLSHFLEQKPEIDIDEEQNVIYGKTILLNLKNVVKAEVDFDLQQLNLYTKETAHTDEPFCFSYQESNYYLLLKTVPLHLFPEDMQSKISDLLQNLESCEICGHKALYHNSCLRCYNESWGSSQYHINDYEDKSEYIKECQMDIFIDEDDNEKYLRNDRSFEKNPAHQILFTPSDLEEYEKLLF
ncbi:hypothetical protein QWZ06_11325 [Chryseobacterium tructae]|uniref:Uncharacterized protein n=1 Tax=Chryseobacterium tructae TaxID=1037380 RepID=A0ABV7XXS8_9FLAO|nr:hypothetical protein [Chryseobacterium tructae]MDN3692826.1 hypothetical protein [Chryseobacterium tructae]